LLTIAFRDTIMPGYGKKPSHPKLIRFPKGPPVFRKIPKVDKVMEWSGIRQLLADTPRPLVLSAVRSTLDSLRTAVAQDAADTDSFGEEALTERVRGVLEKANAPGLRRVINGTGVVLHTNLGRAPLAESLGEAVVEAACGYSTLEFDLEKGSRGSRSVHVEALLRRLTGAEAAVVVNNNAAAVLLALSSLARGKEVIVSRGELVEIGGSFRIPEVMEQSGAVLREAGATNRTHARDYRAAVTAETALLLKVHTSNFAIVGFTSEVSVDELVGIGRENSLPVMVDAGSGTLVDLAARGLPGELAVKDYLSAGADVVTFSGDKLLGGPQAGIIVGKAQFLEPMKRHPLMRALRVDKMTFAALEGTLRLYLDEQVALRRIPTLRMLTVGADELENRARAAVRKIRRALPARMSVKSESGTSQVGGGTFPLLELPTTVISVSVEGFSAQWLEERLRSAPIPIIGRINRDVFLLDIRTITDDEIPLVIDALSSIAQAV